jgi:hypothetical protein
MLKRLFLIVPLLFVLFTTRASIESILLGTGVEQESSCYADNNKDGIRVSLGVSQEIFSFFEADEEDDEDDHYSGSLKAVNNEIFSLCSLNKSISVYEQCLNSRLRLYVLFHSWKFDLLK